MKENNYPVNELFESLQIVLLLEAINKSEIIGYDMDQIIVRSEIPVVEAFNKKHKTNFSWQNHGYGSMRNWLRDQLNYKDEDLINSEALRFWENSDLLFRAPLIQSTIKFMKLMKILGKEQYIITSRKPNLGNMTLKYLKLNRVTDIVPEKNILINKCVDVDGFKYKALMIKDLGVQLMFEDSLNQIEEIVRLQTMSLHSTKVVWMPTGVDKYIKKPSNSNVIKITDEHILPYLVAQSY